MLDIDDIHVFYNQIEAVKGVSIKIEKGQIVALLGANGSGKTTTLRAASGLERVRAGAISFGGQAIGKLRPDAIAALGLIQIPEGRRIFQRLTTDENIRMGAFCRRDRAEIARDREKVLDLFPRLRERINQVAGTFSGGEQQMLAMARALMGRPRLLLMDEPSMGLSPAMVQHVFETIRAINKEGVTILLVEQNAVAALEIADRAYVLESGRIAHEGLAAHLAGNDVVRRAYLG